jgi:DNA-binding MarR family transcriptional regulator
MSWILEYEMDAVPAATPTDAPSVPTSAERDRLLRRMGESLDRLTRRLGRQWGPLTHSQWAMLRRLLDGPVLVGVLAERLDISTAGATRMLDKLEQAGYVCRSRATDDLRQVAASLTARGRQAVGEAFLVHVARLGQLAEPLSTEELAGWLELLERMAPPKRCTPLAMRSDETVAPPDGTPAAVLAVTD